MSIATMKPNAEPPPDGKHSISIGAFIVWPVVAFMLYILSTGPLMRLAETKYFENHPAMGDWIEKAYAPIEWAYEETPMHKPLGM
jgi:hypothetical protein